MRRCKQGSFSAQRPCWSPETIRAHRGIEHFNILSEVTQDRHNRAEGFIADIEKYFEAALAGRTVIRLSERELTLESVERIVRFVRR